MTVRNYTEITTAAFLLAFSVFSWVQASAISGGAGTFPKLIVYVLTFFSFVYLVRSIIVAGPAIQVIEQRWAFAVLLVIALIYINAVTYVGYVTSSIVFIPLCAWLVGFRRPIYIAIVTLVYLISVYVLFEIVFGRPLPSELLLEYLRRLG